MLWKCSSYPTVISVHIGIRETPGCCSTLFSIDVSEHVTLLMPPKHYMIIAQTKHYMIIAQTKHYMIIAQTKHYMIIAQTKHYMIIAQTKHYMVIAQTKHYMIIAQTKHYMVIAQTPSLFPCSDYWFRSVYLYLQQIVFVRACVHVYIPNVCACMCTFQMFSEKLAVCKATCTKK